MRIQPPVDLPYCASVDWPAILSGYARQVNPLMGSLLGPMDYYWVTAQCEYATDVMFRIPADLNELYPKLLSYSMQYFGATEVTSFFLERSWSDNSVGKWSAI